jgi:hypothetical protein
MVLKSLVELDRRGPADLAMAGGANANNPFFLYVLFATGVFVFVAFTTRLGSLFYLQKNHT